MIKICGVVVLYNPNNKVIQNIQSYIEHVDKLYIIDNSFANNDELISPLIGQYNIYYKCNNQNLGLAKALNMAVTLATKDGYQWLLTMDQDSSFLSFSNYANCFLQLIIKEERVGIVTLKHTHDEYQINNQLEYCKYEYKNMVITSANIINIDALEVTKGFDELLFIDMLDYDLCNKMILNNYKIIEFKNLYLLHFIGEIFKRKNLITRQIREKIEHNPQRVYYMTRNRLYLSKKYAKLFPMEYGFFRTINLLFIHDITKIILYEGDKYKKLYAKFLGLYHYLIEKMGKVNI